jgi:adenylate cyclase
MSADPDTAAADPQRELEFLRLQLDRLAGDQLRADSQISRLRYELRQRKLAFELLSKLFISLDVTAQVDAIYARVCAQTCATLKTDRAVLLQPDEAADAWRPALWSGYSGAEAARLAPRRLRLPPEFLGRQGLILLTRESVRSELEAELSLQLEIPFLIAVPIMGGASSVAAVLVVGRNKEVKPFAPPLDSGDVNSLQAISGFVAAAIQNAALVQLERQERFVRDTFGRYLSDDVVTRLLGDPAGLSLGGESRELSIMMSDLRGFTQLCEALQPAQTVKLLNNYLGAMTEVIQRHQGTIDEFIGDAIMVIFGAPVPQEDHADRAIACALEMQLAMAGVNAWNRSQGLPCIEMGIGIATGDVIIGNIGSTKRAKYGAVGSTVNLAARVESYTLGGQVLVAASTRSAARAALRIDSEFDVRAKGVDGLLALAEVGGIGEPFGLALAAAAQSLQELPAPPALAFTLLEGKHIGGTWISATLAALSDTEAELAAPAQLPPLTNLLLRLPQGAAANVDFYAKTHPRSASVGGRFVVRFTSVPQAVADALAALRPHIPEVA